MKRNTLAVLGAMAALTIAWPSASPVQAAATAAERFKALYTREWNWRQAQYAGLDDEADRANAVRDRFPKVDAATQGERLRYWRQVKDEPGPFRFPSLLRKTRSTTPSTARRSRRSRRARRFATTRSPSTPTRRSGPR